MAEDRSLDFARALADREAEPPETLLEAFDGEVAERVTAMAEELIRQIYTDRRIALPAATYRVTLVLRP